MQACELLITVLYKSYSSMYSDNSVFVVTVLTVCNRRCMRVASYSAGITKKSPRGKMGRQNATAVGFVLGRCAHAMKWVCSGGSGEVCTRHEGDVGCCDKVVTGMLKVEGDMRTNTCILETRARSHVHV